VVVIWNGWRWCEQTLKAIKAMLESRLRKQKAEVKGVEGG
jgi:hypothetical protein